MGKLTFNELKALFPLKANITQDILKKSNVGNIFHCNGANTLKEALGNIADELNNGIYPDNISWGAIEGNIIFNNDSYLVIGTEDNLNFMNVISPQEVTFIIKQVFDSSEKRTVENLKEGDYIAFYWNYNGGVIVKDKGTNKGEIQVSSITSVGDKDVLVHFTYGHHSIGEYVKKENIVAIGNAHGETSFDGWRGKFDLVD